MRSAAPAASVLLSMLALSVACPGPPDDDASPAPGDDDVGDDDSAVPTPDLDGHVEIEGGGSGTVVIELLAATEGALPRRWEVAAGEDFALFSAGAGPVGLRAWLDVDGDGEHDGIWAPPGEPAAKMGLVLPRHGLLLRLRSSVPGPILDGDPEFVDLWDLAWDLATDHVASGTPANGFADHYMDEAFSDQVFQWDTCFMALFGRYGLDAFPVMPSLDNFYGTQGEDGYICRVVNETDGLPGGDAGDPAEPAINPPLFAWVELRYARQTGDLSRLPRVLPVLAAYHGWLDGHVRTAPGLYYTSMLGSGMDNAPRDAAYDGWVDITAQQALARRSEAELRALLGDDEGAEAALAEAERICADVRDLMWDDEDGFFYDLGPGMALLQDRTLASIWPLVAGCATQEQAGRVIGHLRDPAEFWRVHLFPSAAADSAGYNPAGHYWRGGVWAPTTFAAIEALAAYGREDLARAAAENTLRNLHAVAWDYAPDPSLLAPDATGDGTGTLWELYAPDSVAPGTRWDQQYLGRQDFVGWTGLGPIALLLERAIGLSADAPSDTLTWRLSRIDRHGVAGYRFGDQLVDLVAAERNGPGDAATIDVDTTDAFTLEVDLGGARQAFAVPAGHSQVQVGADADGWSGPTVPSGPFPGFAILGNGRVSAVWSDDDGSSDPPGLRHLYLGDFGLDLLDSGRLRVGWDGQRLLPQRVGLDPFFAAWAETSLPDGGRVLWRAFTGQQDAVVVDGVLRGGEAGSHARLAPDLRLRAEPQIDGACGWAGTVLDEADGPALAATLDDGRALAVGTAPPAGSWQAGEFAFDPLAGLLAGTVEPGGRLAMSLDLVAGPGEDVPFRWVVATGQDATAAMETLRGRLEAADPLGEAAASMADFSPEALCGDAGPECSLAAAGLRAARASSLAGLVPADLTGQFVTNGFPQLYPRDGLMVAGALADTGHASHAWEILHYWLDPQREGPQPGEWWARYDALGRGVDAGTGADYDVPEWDAAGYAAVLTERLGPSGLSGEERDVLLAALDLVCLRQDADGLWTEGGIVEWVGRLPGTAMTLWAGLDAGARLADGWGEPERAASYREAAGRARGGLLALLDWSRPVLADERDFGLSYDTSMFLGPAWGYPQDPLLLRSFDWLDAHATAHGDGVRYFEGMGYGQDLFFFTTSALSRYAWRSGRDRRAARMLGWMESFTNRYGLAPERVWADGSGASLASPLSWCAVELPLTILELRRQVEGPVLDGDVRPEEYLRAGGAGTVDHDGAEDAAGSPVALYAAVQGTTLLAGLWLAGDPADAVDGTAYLLFLSGPDGVGPVAQAPGGAPLPFRTEPGALPGAVALVAIDPWTGTCAAGAVDGGGGLPCDGVAFGDRGLEVEVDLPALGLGDEPQVIAVAVLPDGEDAVPEGGSLAVTDDGTALVRFEVDAASVAGQVDPGAGVVVTLSGSLPELGGWAGDALGLADDGTSGDTLAGDGVWTRIVRLPRGPFAYKYLVGVPGDGSWAGVEPVGDDRQGRAWDGDGDGRVGLLDTYGVPGGEVVEP